MRSFLLLCAVLALSLLPRRTSAQTATRDEVAQLRVRLRTDSCDALGFYRLARALESFHQFDAADSAYRTALTIDPQLSGAWLGAGVVQDENRRYWQGLRRLGGDSAAHERGRRDAMVRRAFLLDPFTGTSERPTLGTFRGEEALGRLEWYKQEILRERGSIDSLPPMLLWTHAWLAARDLKFQAAIEDMQALLRVANAIEQQQRTIGLPVRAKDFRYALANLYHLSGDPGMAAQLYRDVIAEDLGNFMAHVQLARIAEARGDSARGLRERRAAVDANPDDQKLVLDLGVALQRAGRLDDAEASFRQARSVNPRDPWVHYRLGALLDERGSREEARTALTTFLSLAPATWTEPRADATRRLEHLR